VPWSPNYLSIAYRPFLAPSPGWPVPLPRAARLESSCSWSAVERREAGLSPRMIRTASCAASLRHRSSHARQPRRPLARLGTHETKCRQPAACRLDDAGKTGSGKIACDLTDASIFRLHRAKAASGNSALVLPAPPPVRFQFSRRQSQLILVKPCSPPRARRSSRFVGPKEGTDEGG